MGVGDAQPHALEPPSPQRAEDLAPERLGLGRTHVQADDLPPTSLVDTVGDRKRLVADPPGSRTRSTLASNHRYG
jgi:hypothetical protein